VAMKLGVPGGTSTWLGGTFYFQGSVARTPPRRCRVKQRTGPPAQSCFTLAGHPYPVQIRRPV